jgi:diguanylate cyclase (GGDEF)-like protein
MTDQPNLHILVIDDNIDIQNDFIKILTTSSSERTELSALEDKIFEEKETTKFKLPSFQIDAASQGQEGVEKIIKAKADGNPYSLAFVDIRMPPGWDGIETIKHIWEVDPDMQIVICTAYSDYTWEDTVDHLGQKDNLLILKKPFDHIAVRQLSCALTKKWQLLQDAHEHTELLEVRVEERTKSLQKSLSITRGTLESSAECILVTDNKNNIIDYNNNVIQMWNIPSNIIEEKDVRVLLQCISDQTENSEDFLKFIDESFKNTELTKIGNVNTKDNRVFEYYSQPYKQEDQIVGRIWSFRDITQRAILEEKLQHEVRHDSLTGLPNRLFLVECIRQNLVLSNSKSSMFGVLFFDLDRFKLVNDSLSHATGDQLLQAIATRLKSTIRNGDSLARLGGDEFVVVITELQNVNDLKKIVIKLLDSFRESFKVDEYFLSITVSIGISIFPQDGRTIDELLRNADVAMYRAKELGGNQFQFYNPLLTQHTAERFEMEADLHRAIENNEFTLYYQPQLDVITQSLVSVEALIRWKHPTKGFILPIKFIPLAESTGLIVPIGEWVIQEACRQNKKWQDMGLPPIRVAVNLASLQLKQPNLIDVVKNALQDTGLKPEYFEVELTENVVINCTESLASIAQLKAMGIQITLDDFGTGFSSLNYLRQMSIDRIKIDQSFVQNINVKNGDEVIIQAIISMAQNLNLEVLAEGVETQEQLKFLKLQECNQVQGYYFSKPVTSTELENILRNPEEIRDEVQKLLRKKLPK